MKYKNITTILVRLYNKEPAQIKFLNRLVGPAFIRARQCGNGCLWHSSVNGLWRGQRIGSLQNSAGAVQQKEFLNGSNQWENSFIYILLAARYDHYIFIPAYWISDLHLRLKSENSFSVSLSVDLTYQTSLSVKILFPIHYFRINRNLFALHEYMQSFSLHKTT